MAKIDPKYIVGMSDIAKKFNVSTGCVWNWTAYHEDFPDEICRIANGPLYDMREVDSWCAANLVNGRKRRSDIQKEK